MKRIGLLVATCAAAALLGPAEAGAQEQAPFVTVGVDVTQASLTEATYSLFVANRGKATADDVVLRAAVPANTTFSASDRSPLPPEAGAAACAPGAPANTTCRWSLGDMPPGASAKVTVRYALAQGGGYTVFNTASVGAGNAEVEQSDTDLSLVRTSDVLDEDTYVDDDRPDTNFGACPELKVRRDNRLTAFVDRDFTIPVDAETVWGAELQATVASVSSFPLGEPTTIAAHREVSHDWTEGRGDCNGQEPAAPSIGVPGDPPTEPESEATPTATTSVAGPGTVRWDVSAALDSREERSGFNGFELRAGGAALMSADTVTLRSSEAAADQPRLVTVRTNRETSRCIDSHAEAATGPSDREQRIDAYVTDAVGGRVSNSGGDACNGTPVSGAAVGWEFDDDSPDAYISSLAGSATSKEAGDPENVGPNDGSTLTDADGASFIEIRLAEPYREGANAGENRIAAIALNQNRDGGTDPSGVANQGTCEPGETSGRGETTECGTDGQSADEDDVLRSWEPVEAPAVIAGEPQPTGSATPVAGPAARSLVLGAAAPRATVGQSVGLRGRLSSAAAACAAEREFVQVLRRSLGARSWVDFASVSTAPDGGFELPLLVEGSAEYRAVAPEGDGCQAASSSPVSVLALGRVLARSAGPRTVTPGARVQILGHVQPARGGSAVLERRVGRRWKRVAAERLDRRSRFSFALRASWSGRRTFRVRWESPTSEYAGGESKPVAVSVRGAR